MKLYHYTTLDTLALILKNRTIKFSRLDKVDDNEEFVVSKGIKFGQYMFVSCWTKEDQELIPLWNMYAKDHNGVRICMEADMFKDYLIPNRILLNGEKSEEYTKCKLPLAELLNLNYFMMNPVFSEAGNYFFQDIEYADDVCKETSDIISINQETGAITIAFPKVGHFKNKRWDFQKETRFKIIAWPINPCYLNGKDITKAVTDAFRNNKELGFDCYFLKLKDEAIDNIEITLRYDATESDRIIAESLCTTFVKNGKVFDSSLKGLVK